MALVEDDGSGLPGPSLPGRGHGVCLRPGTEPRRWCSRAGPAPSPPCSSRAAGWSTAASTPRPTGISTATACSSPSGRILFATENDITRGQGVLGLYDAADGYRRVGEVDAAGIGPHDIALLPDGRTLAVANGGILTLPETGRAMLNLDSMQPSLNLIEAASGRLVEAQRLAPELHQLSIRHLAQAPDGLIAAGMQWEGARRAGPCRWWPYRAAPASCRWRRRPTSWRRWRPISAASPSTAPAR